MFNGKHLSWSLFLINLQVWRSASLLKRDSNLVGFFEFCEIFKNTNSEEHLRMGTFEGP